MINTISGKHGRAAGACIGTRRRSTAQDYSTFTRSRVFSRHSQDKKPVCGKARGRISLSPKVKVCEKMKENLISYHHLSFSKVISFSQKPYLQKSHLFLKSHISFSQVSLALGVTVSSWRHSNTRRCSMKFCYEIP